MPQSSRSIRLAFAALGAAVLTAAAMLFAASRPAAPTPQSGGAVPLAVLGDSDSHAYQDSVSFPPGSAERGGAHRPTSFQWTEVLARLRPAAIDLGPWGTWGSRGSVARVAEWLGRPARAPRKEDHQHNFAVSGALCPHLLEGSWRQAPRLKQLMDAEPARWRRGVVVVRIGVNSFGREADLDRLARDPADRVVQQEIDRCVRTVSGAIDLIRGAHPQTRFVLVGVFDNVHWAKYAVRWQDPVALRNIASGLDRFDEGLRALARARHGIAFFDDRAWFARRWGGRDAQGRPAYRAVTLAKTLRVSNTAGDDPSHAVLADGHAGTAWNGWWAAALVELLNQSFGLKVAPIEDREIAVLLGADRGPGP